MADRKKRRAEAADEDDSITVRNDQSKAALAFKKRLKPDSTILASIKEFSNTVKQEVPETRTLADLNLPHACREVIDLDGQAVEREIEKTVLHITRSILAGHGFGYNVPARGNTNQLYIPELDRIVLKDKTSFRQFANVSSVRKTAITTKILQLVHQLCMKQIHVTKRDLFYTDVKLFQDQGQSDAVLDDVSCMLGCTRSSLNVVASEKGVVVGRLIFSDNGDRIDCTKMGVGGKAIPPNIDRVGDMESDALFILLVLSPNVVTYTTMIRGFCRRQCVDEALKFLDEMVRCGVKPNEITYNTIIQALCDADKLDETGKIVEEMIQGGFKPDACTFNILMNAQCKGGKLEEAVANFDKIAELGLVANSATYSILIRSLCSRGNFDKAVYLFDDLLQKGILLKAGSCTPLVAAYNPMLEFLCEHGKTGKAENFLRQSSMQGTQDPLSFKTVILGHCKEGAPEAGLEILKLMLWRNYSPDIDTYSALMQSFLKKGQLDNARSTFEGMLESGMMPMASTFHILIENLCSYGKVQDASRIMKTMLDKDVRQNIDISTKVLSGLLCQGLSEEAFELLDLLYGKGFLPNMENLMDDLCQEQNYLEAQRLNYFILQKDCYLDITYYNTVLNGLCSSGKAMEAFFLFQRMTEKSKMADVTCCEVLISLLQKDGKLEQAEYVSRRLMLSRNRVNKTRR